jgi:isoleucyl-tRNA synthetase
MEEKSSHSLREESTIQFWKENKSFEKSVQQRPENKEYVFYDGPPFATGTPHYGHLLGLTSKDLFPRFWTMRGFRVERRWGWDCHGLPIENLAERDLKLKEKKDIEAMGIGKFNHYCQSKVLGYALEWKKIVDRLGNWIEFDNSYKTMDNSYMESVWYIFKKLHTDGYIYEGKKVLLYCPHCETPLAKSEIAMDKSYKDITEKTATVKFKVKDEEYSLLAWTTTPWTLIGNVAIAAGSTLTYVKVDYKGEKLVLAKSRLSELGEEVEVLEEFSGEKLIGKEYIPLFSTESDKKGHYVIEGGSEVSEEEGTGLIHMAIYGEFDYEMIKKYDLPIIQHIGNQGELVGGPKEWHGSWFKDTDKLVLNDLEQRNLLVSDKQYTHSYPHCYRCDTPLFYNAVDSWFINIQKAKERLLERAKDVTWSVSHIKEGRFKYIVEGAPDWTISRNRYWATSMPVWNCIDCDQQEIIGSIAELQKKSIEDVPSNVDLHKHVTDEIHLRCKCGSVMNRIPEVIDCWFEASSMPYAAGHYPFENKETFEKRFPADFVSEYIGQTRAWFYYMHVMGVLLFDKAPFKNIVVTGNVLAADGAKMSKSKKNYPDPTRIFDLYGSDALRFYLMSSPLMRAEDLNFKEEGVLEVYRKIVMLLSNVKQFYKMFARKTDKFRAPFEHAMDKWIVTSTQEMIRDVTNAYERYDTISASFAIKKFIDDLSTWYVRRTRSRFRVDDGDAIETLAYVLRNLSLVMAPCTPYIAEDVHQELKQWYDGLAESVHHEEWPTFNEELYSESILTKMGEVRNVVSKALEVRDSSKIPVRQALASVTVKGVEMSEQLQQIVAEEINVKKVVLELGEAVEVTLDTNITPELRREGIARELIRKLNNMRKKKGLNITQRVKLHINSEDKELMQSFEEHQKDILQSVQADHVSLGKNEEAKEIKIKESRYFVYIELL